MNSIRRHALLAAGLVTLEAMVAAQVPPAEPQWQNPNVLMIVLDDLGTEHLNAYQPSASNPPTPNISALASQGVVFTRAYGHPMCSPTRAALMTGRYSFRTGMGYIAEEGGGLFYTVPNTEVFMPEMLRDGFPATLGLYRRGAFGKWHLDGNDTQAGMHPINNGFERFYGHMTNPGGHFDWDLVDSTAAGSTTTPIGGTGVFDDTTWNASVIATEAKDWMNAQSDPFFAYVCFSPPHAPYEIPPFRFLSQSTKNAILALNAAYSPGDRLGTDPAQPGYDSNWTLCFDWMIEAVDGAIGVLLNGLDEQKLANTFVIVVGDNGTFSQLLACDLKANGINTTGHGKRSVYESGIRVPLIVSGPVPNPGTVCSGLVSAVDLWPTVAELTGATIAAPAPLLDGVSFAPLIVSPSAPSARSHVFAQLYQHNGPYTPNPAAAQPLVFNERSISDGEYKYISLWENGVMSWQEAYHLFDATTGLPVDPNEHCDLLAGTSSVTFPSCLTVTCNGVTSQDIARVRGLITQMKQLSGR